MCRNNRVLYFHHWISSCKRHSNFDHLPVLCWCLRSQSTVRRPSRVGRHLYRRAPRCGHFDLRARCLRRSFTCSLRRELHFHELPWMEMDALPSRYHGLPRRPFSANLAKGDLSCDYLNRESCRHTASDWPLGRTRKAGKGRTRLPGNCAQVLHETS